MEIPHMSEWLCAICHLLGAFLLYHIYSIISWRDFKNHVKNRLWQFEIDFFQPCWGTLETVSSKLFYFPDVKKTGAQRSDDQSEAELCPPPAVLRDPTSAESTFHHAPAPLLRGSSYASDARSALAQGHVFPETVRWTWWLQHACPGNSDQLLHEVGTRALQYAIVNSFGICPRMSLKNILFSSKDLFATEDTFRMSVSLFLASYEQALAVNKEKGEHCREAVIRKTGDSRMAPLYSNKKKYLATDGWLEG